MKTTADYLESEGSKDFTKVVIVDPLCHYTTVIAAEMTGLRVIRPPNSGYPEYRVEAKDFAEKIESIKKESGKLPGLIAVTHVESYYGNTNPVREVGKIAKEWNISYMVNAAYTGGVLQLTCEIFKQIS